MGRLGTGERTPKLRVSPISHKRQVGVKLNVGRNVIQTKPPLLRPPYHTRNDARHRLHRAGVVSRPLLTKPCNRPCCVRTFSVHAPLPKAPLEPPPVTPVTPVTPMRGLGWRQAPSCRRKTDHELSGIPSTFAAFHLVISVVFPNLR